MMLQKWYVVELFNIRTLINSISDDSFFFFSILLPIFDLFLLNLEFEQMTAFVATVSFNLIISYMLYLCLCMFPCPSEFNHHF